jgi:chloramphenicol 3-O-phosphotransferase
MEGTVHPMRVVLVGGAPGVGKSTVARRLLHIAARGRSLVQWVDVDALWLHQPWRVDERTKRMVQSNLAAVMANAQIAGVDVLVVTWVFQGPEMHDLVRRLAPRETSFVSIQLLVDETTWRARFGSGGNRPALDAFYVSRYVGAQSTAADHFVDTTELDPLRTAETLADILGL